MEPPQVNTMAPLGKFISTLRSIARADFSYANTIELAKAADWHLEANEPDIGFVRFDVDLVAGQGPKRSLAVEIAEGGNRPMAFVALFFFDEYEKGRGAFDRAYNSALREVVEV